MRALAIPLVFLIACDAPSKNVGNESETQTEVDTMDPEPGSCEAQADEASCEAAPDDGDVSCAWVQVTPVMGGGDFCGFEESYGTCVTTTSYGLGCLSFGNCSDGDAPALHYRQSATNSETIEIVEEICGSDIEGFEDLCQWNPENGVLTDGDQACNCMCGGTGSGLPDLFYEDLTEQGGCADLVLYAHEALDSYAYVVRIDQGIVQDVIDSGTPFQAELDASDVELKVVFGQNVTDGLCDEVETGGKQVFESWSAVGGTLWLDVQPDGDLARAFTQSLDLQWEPDGPFSGNIDFPGMDVENILVGWEPE